MQQESRLEVHMERVAVDATYREELSYQLLSQCGRDADHVELRRVATRMFPELARSANAMSLASIIGHAATLRAQNVQRDERDVTDARLEMTATEPLAYPASYGDLEENMRASLIAFCELNNRSVDARIFDEKTAETLFKRAGGYREMGIPPENVFRELKETLTRSIA